MEQQFISELPANIVFSAGSVKSKSPSNIALIKYWGKRENQIPTNASISYTLTNSYTETELKFEPKSGNDFDVKVFLDKNLQTNFAPKIIQFFERIEAYMPFLRRFRFEVHTHNSFTHSLSLIHI